MKALSFGEGVERSETGEVRRLGVTDLFTRFAALHFPSGIRFHLMPLEKPPKGKPKGLTNTTFYGILPPSEPEKLRNRRPVTPQRGHFCIYGFVTGSGLIQDPSGE